MGENPECLKSNVRCWPTSHASGGSDARCSSDGSRIANVGDAAAGESPRTRPSRGGTGCRRTPTPKPGLLPHTGKGGPARLHPQRAGAASCIRGGARGTTPLSAAPSARPTPAGSCTPMRPAPTSNAPLPLSTGAPMKSQPPSEQRTWDTALGPRPRSARPDGTQAPRGSGHCSSASPHPSAPAESVRERSSHRPRTYGGTCHRSMSRQGSTLRSSAKQPLIARPSPRVEVSRETFGSSGRSDSTASSVPSTMHAAARPGSLGSARVMEPTSLRGSLRLMLAHVSRETVGGLKRRQVSMRAGVARDQTW